MTHPVLYIWLPGTAREALAFYQGIFGGETELHTFEQFGRDDGPPDAIAHGVLSGPVDLFITDAADNEPSASMTGISIALLGTANATTSTEWFRLLSDDGQVIDPLQERGWGAHDGQVKDRYGIRWLIGFQDR